MAGAFIVLQDQTDDSQIIKGKTICVGKGDFTNVYITMDVVWSLVLDAFYTVYFVNLH